MTKVILLAGDKERGMDQRRRQCQDLVRELNQKQSWGLAPETLHALADVILPYVGDDALTRAGVLKKKDKDRLLTLIEHALPCYNLASRHNIEKGWQLSSDQVIALASAALPHYRVVVRT